MGSQLPWPCCVLKQECLKCILALLLYRFVSGSGLYLLGALIPAESRGGPYYSWLVSDPLLFGGEAGTLLCDLAPVLQVLSISHAPLHSSPNVIKAWQMF